MSLEKTLPEFISIVGDVEAARLFDVKERTAKSWRLRARFPQQPKSEEIVVATASHEHGPVTFEGIYSTRNTAA